MSSLKEALLKFGREPVRVSLPELPDLEVFVRSLTAGERLVLEQIKKEGGVMGDHEFCYLGTVDSKGNRLFTADEAKALDGRLASRIAEEVLRASGLIKTAGDEAAKN